MAALSIFADVLRPADAVEHPALLL